MFTGFFESKSVICQLYNNVDVDIPGSLDGKVQVHLFCPPFMDIIAFQINEEPLKQKPTIGL